MFWLTLCAHKEELVADQDTTELVWMRCPPADPEALFVQVASDLLKERPSIRHPSPESLPEFDIPLVGA